jgi:hypothetical protein
MAETSISLAAGQTAPDLEERSGPKLHGMQEVTG